ncbi:MAG TPA: glycoside hydrolase domain-containing protein, partial [Tepidisphaeraceae bacterium]|nr:glycoside hydrolase domain-containing protein [Tepidisphaeraceae bacterium]
QMLASTPTFHVASWGGRGYPSVIHEMTEMAIQKFGQYDHGNQPDHHVLYLYTAAGQPWKTEYWTRRVCRDLYGSGPEGFPGDEDNGEMACWYLLSAMGFYPLCPGRPEYVLTSPLFSKTTIDLPDGKKFIIRADKNYDQNIYVQSRSLGGIPYTNTWITQQAITAGGELTVKLGTTPMKRIVQENELPHSMSMGRD